MSEVTACVSLEKHLLTDLPGTRHAAEQPGDFPVRQTWLMHEKCQCAHYLTTRTFNKPLNEPEEYQTLSWEQCGHPLRFLTCWVPFSLSFPKTFLPIPSSSFPCMNHSMPVGEHVTNQIESS